MAFSKLLLPAWEELHVSPGFSPQHHPIFNRSSLDIQVFRNESESLKVERWSIYPSLHPNVSQLLEEDNLYFDFHTIDDTQDCIREYDTNIMGRFTCSNISCLRHAWSSKKIAVTIRMYVNSEYNAKVYHQHCKGCHRLSQPALNRTYAKIVAYRVKKWNGIEVDLPRYEGQDNRKPHNKELCEGCRDGRCGRCGKMEEVEVKQEDFD